MLITGKLFAQRSHCDNNYSSQLLKHMQIHTLGYLREKCIFTYKNNFEICLQHTRLLLAI